MKSLIIANWKMNPATLKEARDLFVATIRTAGKLRNDKIVVCAPFVYLSHLSKILKAKSHNLKAVLGAQDVFWEDSGSYTGEISAKMLKSLGAQYVIIGHSERRRIGESNEVINKKIKQALENNLKVIFCVGESERDEAGAHFQFLKEEIKKGLEKIPVKLFKNLIITYEPVWAISSSSRSGKASFHADTPEDALEMATYIKRVLVSNYGSISRNIPIIYGGSVDSKNAAAFLEKGNISGLLVGRASWNAKSFGELLNNI